jgi:hypothetical protein
MLIYKWSIILNGSQDRFLFRSWCVDPGGDNGQRDKKVGSEGKLTICCATYSVRRHSYDGLNASSHAESSTYTSGRGRGYPLDRPQARNIGAVQQPPLKITSDVKYHYFVFWAIVINRSAVIYRVKVKEKLIP